MMMANKIFHKPVIAEWLLLVRLIKENYIYE